MGQPQSADLREEPHFLDSLNALKNEAARAVNEGFEVCKNA